MANFGAQYPVFAPFEGDEPAAALPTYGEAITIGKLVSATLSVTRASGELYADDGLDESVNEFASGTVAMDVNDMDDGVAAQVCGSKKDESGEVVDSVEDEAPLGGLGYIKVKLRQGKRKYKAFWYPKTKPTLGDDAATTKSNSITLGTESLSFTIMAPNVGNWRYYKTFDTLAAAKAYIAGKVAGTVQQGG